MSDLPRTQDSLSRRDALNSLSRGDTYDIVVVGGGIHGAATARLAAGLGFKTALLEKADYGAATSSRSSKMAHGGLRYLELLDFEQVFEGIKAREEMFEHIGHLVTPAHFLIPVPQGAWFFKLKLSIGLFLYDLMVRKRERKHRWIPRSKLSFPGFHSRREDLMGCFLYTDGIMSDSRLVIEQVIAARRSGADCLNYCEVSSLTRGPDGVSIINARDVKGGSELRLSTRLVINCAGPWASTVAQNLGAEPSRLAFSRGSHIIFNKPWKGPSLFLPMPGKARYYFVWPHPAGTLVGTTEREVTQVELDPLPSHDEIDEILARLERDIPDAGLRRENACYAFAGIRTLPLRGKNTHSATISRKHIWTHSKGVLTLLGGKYTTASWTALEGVKKAASILGRPLSPAALHAHPELKKLPGSVNEPERAALLKALAERGLTPDDQTRFLQRYGKRLIGSYLDHLSSAHEAQIALEATIALDTEQVESLEDLMRRRLELEYREGHGIESLPIIREVFKRMRPDIDIDSEVEVYKARMKKIADLLAPAPTCTDTRLT